jgi:hypothetical protein
MKITEFFKEYLNAIWSLGLAIMIVLTDFIIPPDISFTAAEGQINSATYSKFIVGSIVLIMLVPFTLYKEKKHFRIWLPVALVMLVVSFFLLFKYLDLKNAASEYDSYRKKRLVVGSTYVPIAKKAVDSMATLGHVLTRQQVLESLGAPEEIWVPEEITANAKKLLIFYSITFGSFCIFLLTGLQCLFTVTRIPAEPD